MGRKVDLTGQRFGRLVAVSESTERDKNNNVIWYCLCDCGNKINVGASRLNAGNTKSCGCSRIRDLAGQRFGMWAVLCKGEKRGKSNSVFWTCVCDCGTRKDVSGGSLRRGESTSCGRCKIKDLTGQRFGRLVVIRDVGRKNGKVVWECLCDCGKYTSISSNRLMTGNTKSCGCLASENLEGERYGKLLVIRRTDERSNNQVVWECLCDCGNYKNVNTGSLGSGNTKSCGCLQYPSGTDSYNYKPHLTDEERMKNRYQLYGNNMVNWRTNIYTRDNYTCQTCGGNQGGNLNAHHLNGWNAFPEQRFDLDNGVTLCTDCHKEFHSQYGYGDNTREQFDEYAESKTLVLN